MDAPSTRPGDAGPAPVPGPLRAAVVVVGLEALALLAAAVVLVVKTLTGTPDSLGRALLAAALAAVGAAALAAGARGIARLRPGARTPVLILQLLALPVSYSLWFQAGRAAYGAPILLAAVVTIYLLFTPAARAALDRPPPGA